MAQLTLTLEKGLSVGDIHHTVCVVREATAADLMAAASDAEQITLAPTGRINDQGLKLFEPAILINPYLMEMHTLRRQVVKIGDIHGPLELEEHWHKLSETDIAWIKAHADILAKAAVAPSEVAQRGREDDQRPAGREGDQSVGDADGLE